MGGLSVVRVGMIAAALCLLGGCASAPVEDAWRPATVEEVDAGFFAYEVRCKGCHDHATQGAPTLDELHEMKPQKIMNSLLTGKMKLLAIGIPESEARNIAAYLTAK